MILNVDYSRAVVIPEVRNEFRNREVKYERRVEPVDSLDIGNSLDGENRNPLYDKNGGIRKWAA